MEEDIKRIESLIKKCNECKLKECINCEISWNEVQAIENILKKHQELQDEYFWQQVRIRNEYIPTSLIKEKIEELKQYKVNLLKKDYAKKQMELPSQNVLVCNAIRDIATTGKIQVLEELLGEEK